MADVELYQVLFIWPHTEPNSVIVTGTFDDWSASTPLTRTQSGFEGTTKIPWGQKIQYKFVVDGQWVTHEDQPTETDPGGFVNNVFTAPPKPAEPEPAPTAIAPAIIDSVALETPVKEVAEPITNGRPTNGHTVATQDAEGKPAETSAARQEEVAYPEHKEGENNASAAPNLEPKDPAGYPQLLSDLADTIAARDGTLSALDYVASGLGAAMHSVVGVDPINLQKIAIPTPKPGDAFTLPAGQKSADLPPEPAPPTAAHITSLNTPSPTVAPLVPIMISPVNAPENNTEATAPVSGASAIVEESAPSTHSPAVANTPAVGESDTKTETPAEQEASKEESAPTLVVENPTSEVTMEEPSGITTSTVEEPVTEVGADASTAPEQRAISKEPVAEEKTEDPLAPEPAADAKPAAVPPTEEVVTESKTEEPAQEKKAAVVEPPADKKPAEPTVQESAPVVAVAEQVKAEESAKEETAPVPTEPDAVMEVKPEEVGLAVAVPPHTEVAVVESPAPAVQPNSSPVVEESESEGLKEEHATPIAAIPSPEAEGAPIFTQAEEAAPASQKEVAKLTTQTSSKPAKAAVEAKPALEVKEETPEKLATNEGTPTPAKNGQSFPSTSESPSATESPSAKSNSRKKRTSIFGKLKNIFHHDKEKEKEK